MYAITGITGKVGGVVAQALLEAGQAVRAVVRDPAKGQAWAARGCEVALADMNDAPALTQAFMGAEAVFVLLPPHFDPAPGFTETRQLVAALYSALLAARPQRVVCISTVGAQAQQQNLLSQLGLLEKGLGDLPLPVTFLRPAWFMENAVWDIPPARESGAIPSFLQPLDRAIPMVATADVGRTAAGLLQTSWTGHCVVELEGPKRYSPNDIAACLARLLRTSVRAEPVPREAWHSCFSAQGMKNPEPRMRMLDGFNEGWLSFEHTARRGTVELEAVLQSLV
jgi:NAD(P)H dehydrogenase (quinone)